MDPTPTVQPPPSPSQSTTKRWGILEILVRVKWVLLRCVLLEIPITVDEVRKRAYKLAPDSVLDSIAASNPSDPVLNLAERIFEWEEDRLKAINDKTSTLMAVCAILITIGGFCISWLATPWYAGLPLLLILIALFICLITIGVSERAAPLLDEALLAADAVAARKSIAESYLIAVNRNQARTDFLVDVYRAANRWLGVGLFLLVVLIVFWPFLEKAQPANLSKSARHPLSI